MSATPYTWVSTATGARTHAVRSHPNGQTVTMCGVVLASWQAAAPGGRRCAKCEAAIEREEPALVKRLSPIQLAIARGFARAAARRRAGEKPEAEGAGRLIVEVR